MEGYCEDIECKAYTSAVEIPFSSFCFCYFVIITSLESNHGYLACQNITSEKRGDWS